MNETTVDIQLLGQFSVRLREMELHLGGAKMRALVAFLAFHQGDKISRQRLTSLLWGDRSESQARQSFRKALSTIRSRFAAQDLAPLKVDKDFVTLQLEHARVDLTAARRLFAQQHHSQLSAAVDAQVGLLEDFPILNCEFDDWLLEARSQYELELNDYVEQACDAFERSGEVPLAASLAKRAVQRDKLSESFARRYMRLAAMEGDGGEAINCYLALCKALREELDTDPSQTTRALAESIRAGSSAAVSDTAQSPETTNERDSFGQDGPLIDDPKPLSPEHQSDDVDLIPQSTSSVAILAFENLTGREDQEYFSDGIADGIITALSRFRSLLVISRHSSFTYKHSDADAVRIANELGVRYLVEGSVRMAGNKVRINAHLVDGRDGSQIWAEQFDGVMDDIFEFQDWITEQIVVSVEPEIASRERRRAKLHAPRTQSAWALLQRGLAHFYLFNSTDRARAVELFRDAIAVDNEFALPYAYASYAIATGLAMDTPLSDISSATESARALADRAIILDHHEPVAHCALGRIHIFYGEPERGILEMKSAVRANPSFSLGHLGLAWGYVHGVGEWEVALEHLDRALLLSPRDPMRWSTLALKGLTLSRLGAHQEAIAYCREAYQFPNVTPIPETFLISTLAHAGMVEDAATLLEQALHKRPNLSEEYLRTKWGRLCQTSIGFLIEGLLKAGMPEKLPQSAN